MGFKFLTVLLLSAWAQSTEKPVVLLCYPSDNLISESCDAFQEQLGKCKKTVIRLNDPSAKEVADKLRELKDPTIPVFISSHGSSFGPEGHKKHYLHSSKGDIPRKDLGPMTIPKSPPGVEFSDISRTLYEDNYYKTVPILQAATDHPKILSACFSGAVTCESDRFSKPIENILNSCSADEVSDSSVVLNGMRQEPVLYWIGQLYCDEKLFKAQDGRDGSTPDGELSSKEIGMFLSEKMGGQQKLEAMFFPVDPKSDLKGFEVLKRQMVPFPFEDAVAVHINSNAKQLEAMAKKFAEKKTDPSKHLQGIFKSAGYVYRLNEKMRKKRTFLIPGVYGGESNVKIAAEKYLAILKERKQIESTLKSSDFTLSVFGKAYAVLVEDTAQPCRTDSLGFTQTPQVKIQIKNTHHLKK